MALSFAFGGSEGTTYEDLKRRQAYAQAMWARGGQGSPKNAWEGLNSAAQSITGALLARKLGRELKGQQDEFGTMFNSALGGFGGQSASVPPAPKVNPVDQAYPVGMEGPAPERNMVTAGGKQYDMGTPNDMGSFIREGLIQRGLPAHVADGFVMNFRDESGLDPSINERAPIVPGSRGGFGLAQWTGPRRKALEAFAAQRGVAVDDPNLQMDFLVHELQGSEAGAARSIMASQDAGSAAQAIVNDFLRPAEQHRAARAANYGGGQSGGVTNPMLLSMISDPRASDAQRGVLQMLLQQQLQNADPMRKLQMQKLQAEIDATGQMTPYQRAQLAMAQARLDKPDPTSDQQNYQFYSEQTKAAGQEPLPFNDWMLQSKRAGAPNVNNVIGSESSYDKELGQSNAKKFIEIQDAAQASQSKIATLDALAGALDQVSYTGFGADTALAMRRAGNAFGLDLGDTGPEEMAKALGNQLALQMRNPSGGAGMPGAMSDKDREFLVASVPGIEKTPEGNRKLIEFSKKIEQRSIDVARLATEYANRNNGRLDYRFFDELAKWADANPLFQQEAAPEPNSAQDDLSTLSDDEIRRRLDALRGGN